MKTSLQKLFEKAQSGDSSAENEIAVYLLRRAGVLLEKQMNFKASPMVDHDDIAVSAVHSMCGRIRDGKIEFRGEAEIGALLKNFVFGKASKYWRQDKTEKRQRDNIVGEHLLVDDQGQQIQLAELAGATDDSVFLDTGSILLMDAKEQEELSRVLQFVAPELQSFIKYLTSKLDEKPRFVLLRLLESDITNRELAKEMDCAEVSIERYRKAIRREFEKYVEAD